MEVCELVTLALKCLAKFIGHRPVRNHVEQDSSSVAYQAVRPTSDHRGSNDTGKGIHPEPAKVPSKQQADDHEYGHCSIGYDVNHRSAHIVVAVRRAMRMFVFLKES